MENQYLARWIEEMKLLCEPDQVCIVTGSPKQFQDLISLQVQKGILKPLSRPGSYLAWSNPEDVARVEEKTFICSTIQSDAGPTNNWREPVKMRESLQHLFKGCMKGRTMYVVPYCMGPLHSPSSKVAVELTDSPYVVVNMQIMTRVGDEALKMLGDQDFVKCLHSVGKPLQPNEQDSTWPCNPAETVIAHFPETREVWSFGSGYGGNALLNKKCFALRIASVMARDEGWMAEHMLIIGVTNPEGEKKYFAAAFPSACGKTNLAMLQSRLEGWKVECIGDDIAWMHWDKKDGRLYAINPENGFFGVAPGTSYKSNFNAMKTIETNTLFTNVGLTDTNDVWWEGMTDQPPQHLINWKGQEWTPASTEKAAHPNARFTAPVSQCPAVDPAYDSPKGVPISGIIFGGRRSSTMPLVRQALSWPHGVFMGASMTSETTAAAKGEVGKLRHDPFAMLPFCGYNMADYFQHWLNQDNGAHKMPAIFYVNWFLKDESGKFLWPGFSENMQVIRWCFNRIDNKVAAVATPIGYLPEQGAIAGDARLFQYDSAAWKQEAQDIGTYFKTFGDRLPQALQAELHKLSLPK